MSARLHQLLIGPAFLRDILVGSACAGFAAKGEAESAALSFYSRDQAGTNAGSYISMTYDTEFAEGHATESFNRRVVDGKCTWPATTSSRRF